MVDYKDNHHSAPFSTMVPSSFPSSDCLVFQNEPSPTDYKALVLVGCGCKSATELLTFIHERQIEKVDLTWADEMGLWHHAIIPVSEINSENALADGLYVRSGENMLFLRPDPLSAKMSPFSQPFLLHLTCEDISHMTAGNPKHSFNYRPNHVNPYSQTHPHSQHVHNFSGRSRSQSRGVGDGGGSIHHTGHYNHSLDPSGFYSMLPYEFGEMNSKRSQTSNNNNNNNNNTNTSPTHLNNGNQHPMNASWASVMSQQLLQTSKRSPEMGGEGSGSSDEEAEIKNNETRVILPHPTSTKKWVPDTNRRGEEKGNANNSNNNNNSVFVPSWTPTTTKKPAQKIAGMPASPNTPPSPNTPHLTSGINSSAPPSSPSSIIGDSPPLSPNPENLSRKKGSNHSNNNSNSNNNNNNNNNNNGNNNNSKTFTFVNSDSPTSSPILSGANSQHAQLSASTSALNSGVKTQTSSITINSGGSTIILPGPPVVPGVPGTASGDGPVIVNGYVLPPVLRPRQYHACKKSGVNIEAKASGKTLKESTLLKEDEDESSDFDIIGKRKPNDLIGSNPFCRHCGATNTPEWRRGPNGTKSLCNACGLHYSKLVKREALVPLKPLGASLKEQMSINSLLN